ncbi:MAG TPA: GNAT family protein, partial [Kofleriaceae bacterium]|nr:GNAT family protein [Kofleriaceae bacterium]
GRALVALEPTADEIARHAPALAEAYNDPRNAPLLGHAEQLDAGDVVDHYAELAAEGARQFHLFVDGALAGDADLRGLEGGEAEFAFLIAAPAAQGQGLGTRFAIMLHALGFAPPPLGAGLETIHASVVPANRASLRVFAKLGYHQDDTPAGRAYADEPGDVVLSIGRATFAALHAEALAAIVVEARG